MQRFLLTLLLAACGARDAHADFSYVGEARDTDRGALLYEEHHLVRVDGATPRERLVLYRCGDGTLFARKQVEYGRDVAAPSFALEDGRFGYREGVRRGEDALDVFVRRDASARERRAALTPGPDLVIDAGFDEFVRRHWDALQRGDALPLDFLVPSRLETLRFKLSRIGPATLAGEAATVFRLGLAGWLGVFAPEIEVGYRNRDRRLMRFDGLTNIRADADDNLTARIEFPPEREQRALDASAWERALDEPLRSCAPGR